MRRAVVTAWLTGWLLMACSEPSIPPEKLRLDLLVDQTEVRFGEAFELRLQVIHENELVPADLDLGPLANLRLDELPAIERGNATHTERTRSFRARAFQTGELTLGPLQVSATPRGGGDAVKTSSGTVQLTVQSALPNPAGEPELGLDVVDPTFPWLRTLLIAGAGVLLLAVLFLLWRWRKKRPQPVAAAKRAPPHERAMARIVRLRGMRPSTLAELQAFYVEISSLVRDYIEGQFGVHAPEMTTEEFLGSAETAARLQAEHRESLREFLLRCDLVKFAGHVPEDAEREALLDAAQRFVEESSGGTTTVASSAATLGAA
jgi:hypothetical protein